MAASACHCRTMSDCGNKIMSTIMKDEEAHGHSSRWGIIQDVGAVSEVYAVEAVICRRGVLGIDPTCLVMH